MNGKEALTIVAWIGPVLVGAVFILAGITKALGPEHFVRHLGNLRLLPARLHLPAALAVVGVQCGLGVALALGLWPAVLLPAGIACLLVLAMLGYWSTATGRTADCGCYNGVFTLSPLQSVLLDVFCASLLGVSLALGGSTGEPGAWRPAVALSATLGGSVLAFGLHRYSARNGRPLVDLTPLKVGRPWRARWLPATAGLPQGDRETLIVFLGASCSHCMQWIKILNAVHHLPGMPTVQGVVTVAPQRLPGYLEQSGARFPVAPITPWAAARLSRSITPTGVLVSGGIIQEKWVRSMPKAFVGRLRAELPAKAAPPGSAPGSV